MGEDKILDKEISRLVRSLEKAPSPELNERIANEVASGPAHPRRSRKWPLVLALVPGGAALLAAFLLMLPISLGKKEPPITEIRTQFELVDKNITIIFIQKPDFKLFEED